ncbi:hypothetical protein [Croceicoccus sp. Ery15]|uniref:hypothetical protein n=1 Tax=Croceicoccus sp. Ery15 TaxID=1703338 RepID=UPI001E5EEAF5|nr:hypothetical protein [Croceicoccus sp. Ery15]
MEIDEHWSSKPATKADVAFVAADAALALRSLQGAMLALRLNDKEAIDHQLADLEKHTNELWKRFKELTGD